MTHVFSRAVVAATLLAAVVACGPGQRPATFPAPPPVSMAAETEVKVGLVAVDPDGDPVTLALGSNAPSWAKLEGTVLTLTPKREDVGEKSFDVVASSQPSPTTASVKVTVTAGADRAPVIDDVAAITMAEGDTKSVTLTATDPDGDAVSFKLVGAVPAWVTLESGTVSLKPTFDSAGTGSLIVRASDPAGLFGEKTINVTVTNVDRAPTLQGPASGTVAEGDVASFAFSAQDPDGDRVTYSLDAGAPDFAKIDASSGVLTVKPGFDAAGAATLGITATANGQTAKASFTLTVTNTNRPPQIARLNDLTVTGGDHGLIALTATDPDGDSLTFSTSGSPFVNASGDSLTYNVPGTAAGQSDVTVTADDGHGGTASTQFRITVLQLQTAPSVSALVQKQNGADIANGAPLATGGFLLGGTTSDGQGDKVNLQIEVRRSGVAFTGTPTAESGLQDDGAVTVSIPALPVGTYHWQARGFDATGMPGPWVAFGADPAFRVNAQSLSGAVTLDEGSYSSHRLLTAHVTATASPGAQLATMAFSQDGQVFDADRAFADTATFLLAQAEGPETVYVRVTDTLGNYGVFSVPVIYDASAPTASMQVMAGSPAAPTSLVNTTNVTLSVAATDSNSGLDKICFSNDGVTFLDFDCQSASATVSKQWTLGGFDGLKVLYAKVTDKAGNTGYATAAVQLDTTAPDLKVTVPLASMWVTNATVPLLVTATDTSGISQLCLAQDAAPFADSGCGAYAASVKWTLTGSEGQHTIRVKVTDGAGNSSTSTTDAITWDTTPPTVSLSIPSLVTVGGTKYANNRQVALSLTAANDAKTMQFSNDGQSWTAEETYSTGKGWVLPSGDGPVSVSVRVRDAAGNLSAASTVDLVLDTTPPSYVSSPKSFVINNDDTYTAQQNVTLSLRNVADATSGLYQVEFFNDSATAGTPAAYTTSQTWALGGSPSSTTPKKVWARVYDRAGNSSLLGDDILWDTSQATMTASVNSTTTTPPAVKSPSVTLYYAVTYSSGSVTSVCAQNEQSAPNCSLAPPTATGTQKSTAWTLSSGDGPKLIQMSAARSSGASASTQVSVILDTVAPVLATVTPKGLTNGWTNATSVGLDFTTSGTETSPITDSCVSTTTTPCTSYGTQTGTTTTVALGAEGTATLYLRLRDQAGNESAGTTAATVKIDRTTPTGSFTVNSGATYSTKNQVTLNLVSPADPAGTGGAAASGLSTLVVSDDSGSGTTVIPYVAGTTNYAYTLGGTDGARTVTVKLCDVAGNCNSSQATITLDTAAPTGTLVLSPTHKVVVGTTKYTNDATVTATVTSSETGSFCVQTSTTAPAAGASCWTSFSGLKTGSTTVTLGSGDGPKPYYAFFMDPAGNISAAANDSVWLDTLGPTAPTIGTIQPTHHQAYVPWSASTDSGCGVASYELAWTPNVYASPVVWDYNSPTGPTATSDTMLDLLDDRTLYFMVRVKDALGNTTVSNVSSAWLPAPFHVFYRGPTTEDLNDVAASGANVLAVGNTGLALSSTDSGGTWTRHDMGVDVKWASVDMNPYNQYQAVAVSALGDVAETRSLGTWWKLQKGALANTVAVRYLSGTSTSPKFVAAGYIASLAFCFPVKCVTYTPYVYTATLNTFQADETWTPVAVTNGVGLTRDMAVCPSSLSGCPAAGGIVLAMNNGNIYHSADGGATWGKYGYGATTDVKALARLSGSTTTYFLLTTTGVVYASTDSGHTWANVLTLPTSFAATSISSPAAGKLLVTGTDVNPALARVMEYSVACTTGCTLTQAASSTLQVAGIAAVAPTSSTAIALVGSRGAVATGTLSGTYALTMKQPGSFTHFAAASLTPGQFWAGGTNAAGGITVARLSRSGLPVTASVPSQPAFTQMTDTTSSYSLTGVSALDDNTAVAVGYMTSGTTNYARVWSATTSSGSLIATTPTGMTTTQARLLAVSCAVNGSSKFCVAVGDNATVATFNGSTWAMQTFSAGGATYYGVNVYWPSGTSQPKVTVVGTDPQNPANGAVFTALGKADASGLVTPPNIVALGVTVPPLYAVARNAAGTRLIAVGNNGSAIVSSDSGATWSSVTTGTTRTLLSIANAGTTWAVGASSGTALISLNDGSTWSTMNTLDSVNNLTGIAVNSASKEVWIAGQNGTVLYSQTNGF